MDKKLLFSLRAVMILAMAFFHQSASAQTPQFYKGPGTTSSQFPFKNNGGAKCQLWYAPGDFNTLPISGYITTIYFRSQYAAQAGTYINFRVSMKQPTSGTGFINATTFESGGFTQAHFNTLESIAGSPVIGGWYAISLSTPYLYDNTLPLVVETQYDAPFGGVGLDNFASSTTLFRKIYASSLTAATGSASNGFWQDFGMDIIPPGPCTSPPTPGIAQASTVTACPGSNVMLTLQGQTQGTGQTYQWESAASLSGPWTPEGSSSSTAALNVTPAVGTTHFQCVVTCGATSATSTPVTVNVLSAFSGNYTVNALQPVSATNFQTFSSLTAALTCAGVSGPVTINVAPNSGPYNEQVVMNAIPGASASTPIIINGNGETVSFTSTASAARTTILLNGASFVTLNNLNIIANGVTYGWGVQFTNNADNDTVKNCTISVVSTSTTAANTVGIVASGSTTSITTAGNSDNIVIQNNTISGAYQGIVVIGATATPLANNIIENNTIKDFYATGISLTGNTGAVVAGNDIKRDTRVAVTTFTGIELAAGNLQTKINGNKIHDTHNAATTQSGIAYGIHINACDAPSGQENVVTNNLIYNFNSTTGIQNGLRNTGSDGTFFYHNTVVHDDALSTSGATYSFYQTTAATGIDVRNNVFYIGRAGSGAKHCVYLNTNTSTVTSNNNLLYINAPSGTNYIGRSNAVDYNTLVGWQGVGFDVNGSDLNPVFQDAPGLDFSTTNATVNNIGTPLVAAPTDIRNYTRSAVLPDVGAFENPIFPLAVKLLNFNVRRKENDVILTWDVASEKDMNSYEVQRSFNGIDFDKIGMVKANSKGSYAKYDFKDASIMEEGESPKLFYRLKMIDKEDKFEYSHVARLSIDPTHDFDFSVYPNPVTDELTIKVLGPNAHEGTIKIVDVTGKVLQTLKLTGSVQTISVKNLASGFYSIIYNDDTHTQSLTIQKL